MPDDISGEPTERIEPSIDFPVVGIGASAGGLEAVTEMFRSIGENPGMAFVLVQHLDPNHESMMAELLSRKTKLTVRQIENEDLIEADHLYIIPPGHSLSVVDTRFRLDNFSEPRGLRRPIDSFFNSLSAAQGHLAACVVLSGTGADGSSGMRAIKDAGGICVAQKPEEARYDGMPAAAIATGLVDFTLSASAIVERIGAFFSRRLDPDALEEANDVVEVIDDLCGILREVVGHDFSGYKRSTMIRRIERRMQILELKTSNDYISFLKEKEEECDTLFQDLLINVTAFFRDPEHFESLREKVLDPMIRSSSAADEIRIWAPGCSSGQEAYSIAMLIDEALKDNSRRPIVQIFATDIDPKMIEIAREARYSASALGDIPERLRERYTIGLDGQIQITPRIRDMVRFSVHSLIKDPPFSKLDLVCCRNLLIYFGDQVQDAVIPLMHFSLRPGGHLFLGNSENITRRTDLFEIVDQRARIFKRRETSARYPIQLPLGADYGRRARRPYGAMPRDEDFPRSERSDSSRAVLFEQYAPPFVRVEEDGRIVDSSGDLSLFLQTRPSEERTLHTLARSGLREVVTSLVSDARAQQRRLALKNIEISSQFGVQKADVVAHPLTDGSIAVVFIAKDRFARAVDEYSVEPASRDQRISDLQEELQTTRHRLKSTIEELETANEELKSSNEEMMSMNEELQSANEELTTANEELKNKVDELAVVNGDLQNFMQSADMPIIVVDRHLRIHHFTKAACGIFPLQEQDRGRVLDEINHAIDDIRLSRHARKTIQTGGTYENTVHTIEGDQAFLLRILPYFSVDGSSVEGATLTFSEVTRLVKLEDDLRVESERFSLALATGEMGVFDFEIDTGGVTIDRRVRELFGLGDMPTPTLADMNAKVHPSDLPAARAAFTAMVEKGAPYEQEFRVHAQEGSERWIKAIGSRLTTSSGARKVIGLNFDITEQHEALALRELLLQEMSHRVKNLFAVLLSLIGSSPKQGVTVEDFADKLRARVEALGKAYDLTRLNVHNESVEFRELLTSVMAPHADQRQITLEGDSLKIPIFKITPLGLIFHELATNAFKYGSLNGANGRVLVRWENPERGVASVSWREEGVNFDEVKLKDGFGTRLIAFSVRQLSGEFNRALEKDGLRATLSFRLD